MLFFAYILLGDKMEFINYVMENRLILIPVLYILGYIIKNTSLIKNKYIPLILLVVGVILSVMMGGHIIDNIIQGILVTGVTVMTDQMIKQNAKQE